MIELAARDAGHRSLVTTIATSDAPSIRSALDDRVIRESTDD